MTPILTAPILTEPRSSIFTPPPEKQISTVEVELSLWFAALLAFLSEKNPQVVESNAKQNLNRNWKGEIRVVGWGLLKCMQLTTDPSASSLLKADALADVQKSLQKSFALCESLSTLEKIDSTAWTAWCANLTSELNNCEAVATLLGRYRATKNGTLPLALEWLEQHPQLQGVLGTDMRELFGQMCGILERSELVERMLQDDQPLKPSLLLFALLKLEADDLLKQAERTMSLLPTESPLYEILDGFVYITPMELRKVYEHELVGMAQMRQALTIYASVENACGLIKNCFQQAIVALAQVFAPELKASEVFTNYQTKLNQSLVLRRELWIILQLVNKVEKSLDPTFLNKLNELLTGFRQNAMTYLMFKDIETTERFIEEIARTRRNEEIGQVLHRFGAYLETLLSQVNMRNVLADSPFDYPEVTF